MSCWLHPDAEAELTDAAVYYAEDGLRVYHFDRFPYTVVYEPDDREGPLIFAIAHQHREPGYWRERL